MPQCSGMSPERASSPGRTRYSGSRCTSRRHQDRLRFGGFFDGSGGRCRKRSTRIRLANGGGLGNCIMAGRVFEYVSGDLTWCCWD
jgi:hypothetical protein